jgi:hypothetical protein
MSTPGHVLTPVEGGLEVIEDLPPLHDLERVVALLVQPRQRPPVQFVAVVLDLVQNFAELQNLFGLFEVVEQVNGGLDGLGGLQDVPGERQGVVRRRLDLE